MIVVTLTDCPISLRGDLTKWLFEINTGVFVGNVSARVRDNLWKRITENVQKGRATMVFSINNEQHMDFRVHNSEWKPIDFDGLKLVLRPSRSREQELANTRMGFSNASKYRMARKRKSATKKEQQVRVEDNNYYEDYIVLDIETTGLDKVHDEIIEVGALKVRQDCIIAEFQMLIKIKRAIPTEIIELTGITDEMLNREGVCCKMVLENLKDFVGMDTICGHNIEFDIGFLNRVCKQEGMDIIDNNRVDTMEMYSNIMRSRRIRQKLIDVALYCGLETKQQHRGIEDCYLIKNVYEVLRNKSK